MLRIFSEEITAIFQEVNPEKLVVIYCDTHVNGVDTFVPFENDEINLEAKGGGGTLFNPVFDYVEKEEINPVALIYLTDLEGSFDFPEPTYATLWVSPIEYSYHSAPWGENVRIDTNAEKRR
jgi:predicted metal-dependent peptidase